MAVLYLGQEVIARLIRGSTSCAGPKLFPCERVRQRSFLELWRVWFGLPLRDYPALFFRTRGCASPAVARFGIPRVSQGFPAGIPGEAVLADSRGPKLLVQLES